MSQKGLTVEFSVPPPRKRREERPTLKDSVPRIARLLTLAHKWEGMVRRGEVKDYAEIARLMGLSRARVAQVSALVLLSPRIQQELLNEAQGIPERRLRKASRAPCWRDQERIVQKRHH